MYHTYSFTTDSGRVTVEALTLGDALDLLKAQSAKLIASTFILDGKTMDLSQAVVLA